jgi:hypothetical protein
MAKNTTSDQEKFKKIHPSLFIGLGGTGKHILLSLRRKFFEKFGLKSGFPIMEFLWLDTDMQNVGIDGEKLDYALEEVLFQPDELIDLQIPESTFKSYVSFKEEHPHIWEWLPHTLEATGPPKNGARQIRPLGRLGYFYKYNEIVRKLDQLKNRISSRENVNKTQEMGIEVDSSETDIYIVFSVAGGTGSGIFLDMAFTIKEHFTSGINSIGYIVLPSVFWHDKSHRIFANSYSALKELEYYSLRKDFLNKDEASAHKKHESKHDFLHWYSAGGVQKRVMGPPFDIHYLVDNQTSLGYTINLENKGQLLDMAAEDIFLQFASPYSFGSIIKSIQANAHALLEKHYLFEIFDEKRPGEVKYSNAYSLHNAVMGLSKIYIPIDKIKKSCSFKLAMDIVSDWIKEPERDFDVTHLVEKGMYDYLKLSRGENGKTFVDRINRTGERTFEASLDEWINNLRNQMIPKIDRSVPRVDKEIVNAYEQYLKENVERIGTRKGLIVDGIESNVNNLVKEMEDGIVEKINEILGEPEFRFAIAKRMLLHFKEKLNFMRETLEKTRNDIRGKISSKYQPNFNNLLNTYSDVERKFSYLKKGTLSKLGGILMKKLKVVLRHEIRILLLEGAIKAIKDLSGFVGYSRTEQTEDGEMIVVEEGLVKKLSDVVEVLKKGILESLNHKYASFSAQEKEYINIGLYNEDLVLNYYKVGEKKVDIDVIQEKSKEFLTEMGLEMYGLISYFSDFGKGKLEEKMIEFCLRPFTAIKRKHEVIKMLYDEKRYDQDARRREVGNFVGNGHPWIKSTGDFMGANAEKMKGDMEKYSILGVYPGKHESYNKFVADVKAEGALEQRFQIADSDENVAFFYTEWVSFPIMYIEGVKEWHDRAYLKYMESGEENLHLEKYYHKYDDLVAISRDELNEYLKSYETLILGFMLGEINVEEEKERDTFRYHIKLETAPGVFHDNKLGDEYFAIKKLQKESNLKKKILELIEDRKMKINLNTEKLWEYYALLKYYWERVFPIRYRGSEAEPVAIKSFENRVIEEEMSLVGGKLKKALKEVTGLDEVDINKEISQKLDSLLVNLDQFSTKIGDTPRRVLKR